MALRGDVDIREKTKMAEDGESSLDHAFVKVCDIFGFEKLNKHQEEAIRQVVELKVDVYVNLLMESLLCSKLYLRYLLRWINARRIL